MVGGYPVKVYVDQEDRNCYIFPLFGRYYSLGSDQGALDFATDFLLNKSQNNVVSFQSYVNSLENTMPIYVDTPAA